MKSDRRSPGAGLQRTDRKRLMSSPFLTLSPSRPNTRMNPLTWPVGRPRPHTLTCRVAAEPIAPTSTRCSRVRCKPSPSHFITIQVQQEDNAKGRSSDTPPPTPAPPLARPLTHSQAFFRSISSSHSLCSLMFYLISHNKASL